MEYLPTIYLVDGRGEDCETLVGETGIIWVRFIGAIKFPGVVIADMSDRLEFRDDHSDCSDNSSKQIMK